MAKNKLTQWLVPFFVGLVFDWFWLPISIRGYQVRLDFYRLRPRQFAEFSFWLEEAFQARYCEWRVFFGFSNGQRSERGAWSREWCDGNLLLRVDFREWTLESGLPNHYRLWLMTHKLWLANCELPKKLEGTLLWALTTLVNGGLIEGWSNWVS